MKIVTLSVKIGNNSMLIYDRYTGNKTTLWNYR